MVGYAEDGETVTVRLALTPENTEKLYARCYAYDGYFTDWTGKETIYSTLYLPIDPSWISVNLREYNIGESGGAFVNKNKTMIDDFATNYPHHLEEKVIPEGAHYIAITCKDADPYHNIYITMRRHRLLGQHDTGSVWRDKKVVWIGTSIPWGQGSEKSYALELSRHLGFDLVPAFAPGLAIHLQNHNVLQYGSLSASKTEYANQGITIPDEPPVWSPGTGNSYYYRTWSNVFNSANADADLFVFDVLPNNNNWSLHNWEAFDHENWRYKDDSLFASHRDTFLGAMLHLMDKMYACNPKARMVLMITSHLSMAGWENLRLLSEQYNIPIINVWERVNTTPAAKAQLIQTDGVHLTTYAHELIGRMLVGEFLRIA